MSSYQIPAPETFNFTKPEEWPKWSRRFDRFRIASNLSSKSGENQVNTLIYTMGSDAEEILKSFDLSEEDQKDYAKVLERFESHFVKKRNVIYERAKFNQRRQQDGESVDSFITALYTLVEHCGFGELRDEMIRDRIVVGLLNPRLSEKLQMDDKLTLESAVTQARQSEAVKLQQAVVRGHVDIDAIDRRKQKPNRLQFTRASKPDQRGKVCFRCGKGPPHPRLQCPAKNSICHNCKNKGHFKAMCRTKSTVSTVSTVNSSDKPDAFLGTVRSVEKGKPWMVDLEVNNRNLKFKMDMGADVTVLPLKQYDETKDGQLKFPTRNLYRPDRRILPTKGAINATISKHGRTLSNRVIYIMEGLDTPLLGRSVIEDLNLIARLHTVNTTKQSITERYSELFQGLGEMEGEYEIRLKDEVQPFVLHTPRRIPLPLLPKVKEELRRMQELGVISPVTEPTDWCVSMVVVPKSDGRVRICVDLTRLNKDVQRERHIIPSVEHTLAQLGGAKVFRKLDANSGFWQIKLADKSSFLTTFITPGDFSSIVCLLAFWHNVSTRTLSKEDDGVAHRTGWSCLYVR